ncbi:unnamed protein product [Phytophthora fragariaefolia]|uniref:Unnamed protein product n=1 Tax=Phytophthora fragariaefolia TaxID=1490495 RepID=A0A9W7CNJ4_9STRA|nr:unnamed protein product [Phytophthora fragariaefolia]
MIQLCQATDLKKTLIYENSQINPKLSTAGTNTDPLEVNVKPMMVDTGLSVKPDTSDATATAKPSVSDAGISVKPTIANIGIDNSVRMKDVESSTNTAIREDQVASRNWIKAFLKSNPNWASIGINPVKRDGSDDEKRVIREIGSIRSSNSIDEVGAMRSQDKPLRSDRKRKGEDDIEDLDMDDDEAKIDVFGVDSNKHHPAVQKDVDWIATPERFLSITKEKGLSLVSNIGMANEKKVKPYELAENIIDERPGVNTVERNTWIKIFQFPKLKLKPFSLSIIRSLRKIK